MRRVGKTVASLACACCAAQCVPGAVDPGPSSLDGGVLANPLLQDTFTQDCPPRPGTPGPQDPAGVLKRLGGSSPWVSGFHILLGVELTTTSFPK